MSQQQVDRLELRMSQLEMRMQQVEESLAEAGSASIEQTAEIVRLRLGSEESGT